MNALADARERWAIGSPDTARRHAEVAAIVIGEIERDLYEEIREILAQARTRVRPGGRIDRGKAMVDYLDLQLFPLTEGERVQFQMLSGPMWRPAAFVRMVTEPGQDGNTTPRYLVIRPSGQQVEAYPLMIRRPCKD